MTMVALNMSPASLGKEMSAYCVTVQLSVQLKHRREVKTTSEGKRCFL